ERYSCQKVSPKTLEVLGILPLQFLFNGLEEKPRFIGQSTDWAFQPREPFACRAAAQDRSGNMCAMSGIEICRSIIAARIFYVAAVIRRYRIALYPGHPFAEIGMDRFRITGIESGVADRDRFSTPGQPESRIS